MADRTIKPDDTNDLVLQNNDGSAKLELNEDQTVKVTTGSDAGEDFTVNSTQLVVEGDSGNVGIGTSSPTSFGGFTTVHHKNASGNAINLTETDGGVISQEIATDDSSGSVLIGARSNHPLRFSVNDTEKVRIDTSGNLKFDSGFGSVATVYGCRAWINFDGTSGSIGTGRGSGNVSSVTDNGTGNYTINFTSNMPDVNYAVIGMSQYLNNAGQVILEGPSDATTSSFRVLAKSNQNTSFDAQFISVAVFR